MTIHVPVRIQAAAVDVDPPAEEAARRIDVHVEGGVWLTDDLLRVDRRGVCDVAGITVELRGGFDADGDARPVRRLVLDVDELPALRRALEETEAAIGRSLPAEAPWQWQD